MILWILMPLAKIEQTGITKADNQLLNVSQIDKDSRYANPEEVQK